MQTVHQLLEKKGREVWSVAGAATVFEALELMADKNIGAVLVVDGDKPVGVLSERDYARKVVLKSRMSRNTAVSEIMTPNPVCVSSGRTDEECMALMTAKRVRHLPVIDHDRLVGLVSIGDVVKSVLADREFLIEQLESYISG